MFFTRFPGASHKHVLGVLLGQNACSWAGPQGYAWPMESAFNRANRPVEIPVTALAPTMKIIQPFLPDLVPTMKIRLEHFYQI